MILTFDVGNSNIVMGCVENGVCGFRCRLSTVKSRTAEEYSVLLSQIAAQDGVALESAEGAIIASVVPELNQVISDAVKRIIKKAPMMVGPGVKTGLNIRIDEPGELGADFVAAAAAALQQYKLPCVTVDMSTATAFGVLDKNGNYIGGAICPGLTVALNALAGSTSQLHNVRMTAPAHVVEKSTAGSMQSGLIFGCAALLDGMILRIEEELGEPVSAVVTGDLARTVLPHCKRRDIVYDPDLLMHGLWLIYQKNRKS